VKFRGAQNQLRAIQEHTALLLNPLGEAKDAKPALKVIFSKAFEAAFRPRSALCAALAKAAREKLPSFTTAIPPVFRLALASPNLDRFMPLLPDLRLEHSQYDLSDLRLEEIVWGVPPITTDRVKALCDEYVAMFGESTSRELLNRSASLACVKVQGVVNLKVLMKAAIAKLDSLSPVGAWSTRKLEYASAQQASDTYVGAVRHAARQEHLPLLSNLSTILWNREYMGRDERKASELQLRKPSLVGGALEAAVLNRLGVAAYHELKNDIQIYLNSYSRQHLASQEKLLAALHFKKKEPAGVFLTTLLHASEKWHPLEALARASKAVPELCNDEAIRMLLKVESFVSVAPRPRPYELDAHPEYQARQILESVLLEYGQIADANLLWRTAPSHKSLTLRDGQEIPASQIQGLVGVSNLLAGIPTQDLRELLARPA
jgi:hypothetical protein